MDTCRTNPKANINVFVSALRIDWKKTVAESQVVAIPGFTDTTFGNVNIEVEMNSDTNGDIKLKVCTNF